MMVKLSEPTTAEEIHERDMADPAYRAEYERTRFANDIAIRVQRYRTEHGLTQTAFGQLVGMRQPHVARLESGEHEPSLSTLVRLAGALGEDFTVDIKPERSPPASERVARSHFRRLPREAGLGSRDGDAGILRALTSGRHR